MDINKRKQNRFLFLKTVFESGSGSENAVFDISEVGKELGFNEEETNQIVSYLFNEDLLEPHGLGGTINITHLGIKEIEEALENPNKPTQHFLPVNIINIGTMTNSNLQQATTNSQINVNLTNQNLDELSTIIDYLNSIQSDLNISKELQLELISEIQTLEVQKQSPRPKSIIIKESLKTIRSLLESVAGNILTPPILLQISQFMHTAL